MLDIGIKMTIRLYYATYPNQKALRSYLTTCTSAQHLWTCRVCLWARGKMWYLQGQTNSLPFWSKVRRHRMAIDKLIQFRMFEWSVPQYYESSGLSSSSVSSSHSSIFVLCQSILFCQDQPSESGGIRIGTNIVHSGYLQDMSMEGLPRIMTLWPTP